MRHLVRNRGFEPRGGGGDHPFPFVQNGSSERSRAEISHKSSPQNVGDLYLRTAQGRNVWGLNCIGGPFRLCRYYYNTTDSAQVSMMFTVEKCHELLCKTVKIAERCILPYLCQLTKALRNGSGDRPRV